MVLTSWGIPFLFTLTLVSLIKLSAIDLARTFSSYLGLLFEVILCVILIFFLVSMFLVVYNLNSRDRTLAKQLRFNQLVARAKTQNTSAVKWVALITFVFLSCYVIMMRCSLLLLTDNQSCNDSYFKISLRVINSGIINSCQDYARLLEFASRNNLVRNVNVFSSIHVFRYLL